MPNLRERAAALLAGRNAEVVSVDRIDAIREAQQMLYDAYKAGPFDLTPEKLAAQLRELDPYLIQDVINAIEYKSIGGYGLDATAERERAVLEARRLFKCDVVTERGIGIWTDFGYGENIVIKPLDETDVVDDESRAVRVFNRFWHYPDNRIVLGARELQHLSEQLLTDGEMALAFYVDKQGAKPPRIRVIPVDEIKKIAVDPNDRSTVLWYKRAWTEAETGEQMELWYPDWLAGLTYDEEGRPIGEDPDLDELTTITNRVTGKEVVLVPEATPEEANRADEVNGETFACIIYLRHNVKSDGRGWPQGKSGFPWSREHKRFRENRAAVAAAVAMFVRKLKTKGGSRGVDAMRALMQSSLVNYATTGSVTDTNPAPAAGSTWLENEAAELSSLKLSTGAQDAKTDGEALLQMAGLPWAVYPHWLGSGDAYRLACYSDDTEVLTEHGWKSWRDWEPGEKIATYKHEGKLIEYLEPTKLHVYDYEGPMYHIKSKSVDALVTPNHRMLAKCENDKRRDGSRRDFEVRTAEDLWTRFILPAQAFIGDVPDVEEFIVPGHTYYCGNHHSCRKVPAVTVKMDDWLEFLGWWIADGCLHTSARQVNICQSTGSPYVDEIDAMFERTGLGFFRAESKEGTYLTWGKTSKGLYEWLERNCGKGAEAKHVPEFVFHLNRRQIEIFLTALWKGDGSFTPEKKRFKGVYTSVSKQLIDDVQILLLHVGDWGRAKLLYGKNMHRDHKKNLAVYRQSRITRKRGLDLSRKRNIEVIDYAGQVWCFEAPPNKMFITRRHGFLLIAGNTAISMEAPTLRAFSRYQLYWSSVWRDVVMLVLMMDARYSDGAYETYDAEVSTDRLVEVDLSGIANAMGLLYLNVVNPAQAAGLIGDAEYAKLTGHVLRVALQALGVADVDSVAGPLFEEPEDGGAEEEPKGEVPPGEEEPEEAEVGGFDQMVRENLATGSTTAEDVALLALDLATKEV